MKTKKKSWKEILVLFKVGMQTRFCRCLRRWWTPTGAHPKWTKCCSSSSTRKTLSGCRKVNTNSFFFQLPVSVHHSTSVSSFKSSLKTFLFSKTFSSVLLPWDTSVCVCVRVCVACFESWKHVHIKNVCLWPVLVRCSKCPVLLLLVFSGRSVDWTAWSDGAVLFCCFQLWTYWLTCMVWWTCSIISLLTSLSVGMSKKPGKSWRLVEISNSVFYAFVLGGGGGGVFVFSLFVFNLFRVFHFIYPFFTYFFLSLFHLFFYILVHSNSWFSWLTVIMCVLCVFSFSASFFFFPFPCGLLPQLVKNQQPQHAVVLAAVFSSFMMWQSFSATHHLFWKLTVKQPRILSLFSCWLLFVKQDWVQETPANTGANYLFEKKIRKHTKKTTIIIMWLRLHSYLI